jgi:hypothetical protein
VWKSDFGGQIFNTHLIYVLHIWIRAYLTRPTIRFAADASCTLPKNPASPQEFIVAPWLFLFTMDEALQNGLQHQPAVRYTPGNDHGKWFKFLNDHRISEAGLIIKSVCRDFLTPVR